MKKIFGLVIAAISPLVLTAGFSQYLDISALSDIPDECKRLSGQISEYGATMNNVWTPADVHAEEETGTLVIDGTYGFRPQSLDEYVAFGNYDDDASITAFMNRGDFYKTDKYGERQLDYTPEAISNIYMEMEDANFKTFADICDEIDKNIEEFEERERQANGGDLSDRAIAARAAFDKFVQSGLDAKIPTAENLLAKFAAKARAAQTDYQKKRSKNELAAAQNSFKNETSILARLKVLQSSVRALRLREINNINRIGAYLGSTNSMAFFSANPRTMTDEEIVNWRNFNPPEQINGDYGLPAAINGGRTWQNVYSQLSSCYMTFAWPIVDVPGWSMPVNGFTQFCNHFNVDQAQNKTLGFNQVVEFDPSVTNWYGIGIKAPKNWADGTTIIVTNGVFKARGSMTITGTEEGAVPVAATNFTFKADTNSNIIVNVVDNGDGSADIEIGVRWK